MCGVNLLHELAIHSDHAPYEGEGGEGRGGVAATMFACVCVFFLRFLAQVCSE